MRPAHEVQYRVQLTYLKANALATTGKVDQAIPLYSEIANQFTLAGMPGEEYGSSVARLVQHGLNANDETVVKQYVHALAIALKASGEKAPPWWHPIFERAERHFFDDES